MKNRLPILAALGISVAGLAQYRPPPKSETEQLVEQGEDDLVNGAKELAAGRADSGKEKYQRAVEKFQRVLTQDANQLRAANGFATAASALGDNAAVVKVIAPIAAAHPDDVELAFRLGVAFYRLKRFDESAPLLEKVSPTMKPEHLTAHYYLGLYQLYHQRGSPAALELERYLTLRPQSLASDDGQILELLAKAYLLAHQPAKARAALEKAQAGHPESLSLQLGLTSVLEMEGRLPEARTQLEGLAQRFAKAPEPRRRLAEVLVKQGDVGDAQRIVNDLLTVDASADAHVVQAEVLIAGGRFAEAEAAAKQALKIAPNLSAGYATWSRAVEKQGRRPEAISEMEKRVAARPDEGAWALLGSMYRRAGRTDEAVKMHQQIVAAAPDASTGYWLLGADAFAAHRWDDAIATYQRGLELDAHSSEGRHGLALSLTRRAIARLSDDRVADADADAQRALSLEETPATLANAAAIRMHQGHFSDARPLLEKASALKGAGAHPVLLLGYCELAEREPGAVKTLERARSLATETSDSQHAALGLALAQIRSGDAEAATDSLQTLAKSDGEVAKLARANLPGALLRRALGRLASRNSAEALNDLKALEAAGSSDLRPMAEIARALAAIESGDAAGARKRLDRVAAKQPAERFALSAAHLYLDYRDAKFAPARKELAKLHPPPERKAWFASLARGIDESEGELAFVRGALPAAEKALKAVSAAEPNNPTAASNLACVTLRKGQRAQAVARWQSLAQSSAIAVLNLALDAQLHEHDPKRAYDLYGQYLAQSAERATTVKTWRHRLAALYGFSDERADAPSERRSQP